MRNPQFLEEARQGFDEIFNLDYEPAIQTFAALQTKYPEHPGPPLYRATAIWLRELFERRDLDLDKFIAPSYFDRATDQRMPLDRQDDGRTLTLKVVGAFPFDLPSGKIDLSRHSTAHGVAFRESLS
ncbi:hypothetical protein MYX82_03635 [Acidobacteria bacterium AH-259-D05]|nr:hypothetical protein [Acidobacteria bacterium AH-259-D05]